MTPITPPSPKAPTASDPRGSCPSSRRRTTGPSAPSASKLTLATSTFSSAIGKCCDSYSRIAIRRSGKRVASGRSGGLTKTCRLSSRRMRAVTAKAMAPVVASKRPHVRHAGVSSAPEAGALGSAGSISPFLFPLDGGGRLGADVVDHAVHAGHLVHDAAADPCQHLVG